MCVVYVIVVLSGGGLVSLLMALVLLEGLSWLFVALVKEVALKYLMVQPFFMLTSLLALSWWVLPLLLALVLKLGVPPFHSWAFHVLSLLNKWWFLFMTTMHKFLPILVLVKLWKGPLLMSVIVTVLAVSLLLLVQSGMMVGVLAFSSMMHSSWLSIGGGMSLSVYISYWLLYSLLMLSLLNTISTLFISGFSQNLATGVHWLFLAGLPPFTLFWLKLIVITGVMTMSIVFAGLLLGLITLSIFAYLRMFVLSGLAKPLNTNMIPLAFLGSALIFY